MSANTALKSKQQLNKLPTLLTDHIRQLIDIENPHDPIAAQFLPTDFEDFILPQESEDVSGDYPHAPVNSIVHRHPSRVLLKPTMVCAVYCRFCFRREMVGPEGDTVTQADVDAGLKYIAEHPEVNEVILTGGDPLMLSPKKLGALIDQIQAIPHIRWIRIHTRIPMVAPDRVTPELLEALKKAKTLIVGVHSNHAREFTPKSEAALARMADAGIVLLGQAVMLKGINADVESLVALFEKMMENRAKPYYLYHAGLTVGTSHFRISVTEGMAIMDKVKERVSGICLPQYILDIPGGVFKIAVNPYNVQAVDGKSGHYVLTDPMGGKHQYSDVIAAREPQSLGSSNG